jgi:hypothetical protein
MGKSGCDRPESWVWRRVSCALAHDVLSSFFNCTSGVKPEVWITGLKPQSEKLDGAPSGTLRLFARPEQTAGAVTNLDYIDNSGPRVGCVNDAIHVGLRSVEELTEFGTLPSKWALARVASPD